MNVEQITYRLKLERACFDVKFDFARGCVLVDFIQTIDAMRFPLNGSAATVESAWRFLAMYLESSSATRGYAALINNVDSEATS